jgi:hypothetical protein
MDAMSLVLVTIGLVPVGLLGLLLACARLERWLGPRAR